jgi:tRNA pseudouridine38-40 synthase
LLEVESWALFVERLPITPVVTSRERNANNHAIPPFLLLLGENQESTDPMHYRYFIRLAFKGTSFHGWQVQPNGNSVQAEMIHALSTLLKEKTEVTGAGRTDAGVHARKFFAHFDSSKQDLSGNKDLLYKLNGILPKDIVAHEIQAVKPDAHARFSAISRTYSYRIHQVKDSFLDGFSAFFPGNLDHEKMNRAAEFLLETTEFTSFSKANTDTRTNLCHVVLAEWIREEYQLIFTIKADRFLRNMVRAIVGTILDVGYDRICLSEFKRIIEMKDRSAAGTSVPAHGLYLEDVEYPEDIFL